MEIPIIKSELYRRNPQQFARELEERNVLIIPGQGLQNGKIKAYHVG